MKQAAIIGFWALMIISCVWAGAFLIISGHEWWSLAPFVIAGGTSIKVS